jgi:chemosensory pili system protein ChpA (sensor histidine kinase/response regulator)
MSGSHDNSIKKGFADEVRTYIPLLNDGVDTLRNLPESPGVIEEIYRLAHIIRGAAALVGLHGLSHTASQMESTLEEVMAGNIERNQDLFDAMSMTIDCVDAYNKGEVTCRKEEIGILSEIVSVFRRIRGLPESDDAKILQPLLDSLYEGETEDETEDEPNGATDDEMDDKSDESVFFSSSQSELELLFPPPSDPFISEPDFELPILDEGAVSNMDPFMGDEDPFEFQEIPQEESADPLAESPRRISCTSPEIVAIFYEEAEAHFETINKNLENLEKRITGNMPFTDDEKEMIRQVSRAVHTIKGASGLVGMKDLSAWAHKVEDLLDWLCEKAVEITPEVVHALLKSTDILETFVSDPAHVSQDDMDRLKNEFLRISETTSDSESQIISDGEQADDDSLTEDQEDQDATGIFDNFPLEDEGTETLVDQTGPKLSKTRETVRMGMDKLDDLVNLASEQIISLSAFDQKLDVFQRSISELELFRSRLREISRNLEVGYEVKAIQQPGREVQPGTEGATDAFSEFDAIELDRYSEFNLMIRALAESVFDVGEITSRFQTFYSNFDGYVTRQRVVLSELQGKLMNSRMAPMSVITTRLRRAIREVADTLGKKIRLTIRGEDIELDRVIWEKLADPLLHILRNAADHGIEMPEIRKKKGKVQTGLVTVTASREGNQILIRIRDDGAGLNFKDIRAKAEILYGTDTVAAMDKNELSQLIFMPGFSTRKNVTQISGRGVGMDVVKTNIEELKGSVRIATPESGKGIVLTVQIPLTLAIINAIICKVEDRQFAVPINEVSNILRVSPENMVYDPAESIMVGNEVLPLYRLSHILGIREPAPGQIEDTKDPIVLKVHSLEKTAALAVDALIGQREIVIKSLGSHLQYVKGISGATVLGDGSIVPILNISELLGEGTMSQSSIETPVNTVEKESLEILIVDDSVSVRQVVARLMEDQGWKTTSARNGVEALEKLTDMTPDLIILDVEMPIMNGYEFLGARRSNTEYRDIPVVILTSRSTAKYREKAKKLGADGYIVKPFNGDTFIAMVQSLTTR